MPHKADILLVTANDHETDAVHAAFRSSASDFPRVVSVANRSYTELMELHQQSIWHMRCQTGSGGIGASLQEVSRAINNLSPRAVIMVGIAMGARKSKQSIGDVLVSRQLTLYEQRRVGKIEIVRGDRASASAALLSRFESSKTMWKPAVPVTVQPGLMLTGDKLVDNEELRKQLLRFEPEAVGVEMEGGGLYVACAEAGIPWIVAKAICDWGDGTKRFKKEERQKTAAANAASFVFHALSLGALLPKLVTVSGPPIAHLYWLGSDLADAFRHANDGEPIDRVAKCLTQALYHFGKAGFSQPEIEDGLTHLATYLGENQSRWTDPQFRGAVATKVIEIKSQVNVFINTSAGPEFRSSADQKR